MTANGSTNLDKRRRSAPLWRGFAALEIVALAAAAFFLYRAVIEIEALRARTAAWSLASGQARRSDEIGVHQGLYGRDAFGRIVNGDVPRGAKYAAFFVVRGATYGADTRYWDHVASFIRPFRRVWLVGYCDGSSCNRATQRNGEPEFDLIGYGEVSGLENANRADQMGEVLLTNRQAIVTAKFPWRRRPADVTAEYLARLP